jgi:hypothetical protein
MHAAAHLMETLSDRKPPLPLPASCTVILSTCSPSAKALDQHAQSQGDSFSNTLVRQRVYGVGAGIPSRSLTCVRVLFGSC